MGLTLLSFPNEIVRLIADHLDPPTLVSLMQTSRWFACAFEPLLYTKALTYKREDDFSVLVWAAEENRLSVLSKILDLGMRKISHKDRFLALYRSSQRGHEDVVRRLLATVPDPDDDRPELRCIAYAEPEVVVQLIMAGMNPYVDIVSTALDGAAKAGRLNVVRMLIEFGVDLNGQSDTLPGAAAAGHEAVVRLLVASGAGKQPNDINHALRASAHAGHTSIVQLLLPLCGPEGPPFEALENAVAGGHEGAVRAILTASETGNGFQANLLMRAASPAVRSAYDEIVRLLLSAIHGPPPRRPLVKLLESAAQHGHVSTLRVLFDFTGTYAPEDYFPKTLVAATQTGRPNVVRFLLEFGASWYIDCPQKDPPILVASRQGHAAVMDLLLNNGADITANDRKGWTGLHEAAFRGHLEVTRILLRAGIDVSIRNFFGETALHRAAVGGAASVARELVGHGVGIDLRDNRQYTALHIAAYEGNKDVVRVLVHAGADTSLHNQVGWTPLDLAAIRGNKSIVAFLLAADGLDASEENVQTVLASITAKTSSYNQMMSLRHQR